MFIPLPFKPKSISEKDNIAVFEIERLYPGYGQTVGNGLRRVLLSSLEGAVITSIKITGVGHEFSTIEGVKEDIVELMLNLKQLRFRMHEPGPFTITMSAKGEKEVTGRDFDMPTQVEIVSPDEHVATLTSKKSALEMEATVETGVGYVPAEVRSKEKVQIGLIALDASFSPVRHVNYEVYDMRVGERTDYNLLRVTLETDGSLTPREALHRASEILVAQFTELAAGFAEPSEFRVETSEEDAVQSEMSMRERTTGADKTQEDAMKIKLDTLRISSRTLNVLREGGIKTVGGVARKREEALREIEGLGDKGIGEIKKELGKLGVLLKQ